MIRRRRRLWALSLIVSASVVVASPALAGTIATPSSKSYNVPLNWQGTGPAAFPIAVSGYAPNVEVFAIICDGVSPTTSGWDPTLNCDNVTSPAGRATDAGGKASWDPGNKNERIGVFDGPGPSATFNCLYPGQPDPNNGAPSWGSSGPRPSGGGGAGCQLRVATTNAAVTGDQAFVTLVLPRPTCGSHCPAGAGSSFAAQGSGAPASGQGASVGGSAGEGSGSAAGKGGLGTSRGSHGSSWLAMTGANVLRLVLVGVALIAFGLLVARWSRRRRSAEIA